VKSFIYDDLPLYDEVEFKKVPGAAPFIMFYNSVGEEIEKIELTDKNREECNALLKERGFSARERTTEPATSGIKGDL